MQDHPYCIASKIKSAIAALFFLRFPANALAAVPTAGFEAGSVHVDRYGSGNRTLVLIPGLTDSSAVWNATVARYSGAHTITF